MKFIEYKNNNMSKLGTRNKPAVVKVQTEERAIEIMGLCNQKGWQVIVGIEPDMEENIKDVEKLLNGPCGSGKQHKRCCGK
jgi:uncharacterized protein YchJ